MGYNNNENETLNQEKEEEKLSYIFKVPHKKNFTVIDNHILYNKKLSAKATCYLCILLSFPDHWKVCLEHLATLKTDGIKAVKSALTELKEHGYVFFYQGRSKEGKFYPSVYIVSETAKTKEEIEEFKKSLPQAYFGLAEKGLAEKGRLVNTNKEVNINISKKQNGISPSSSSKKEIKKNVFISDEEHQNLLKSNSNEKIDECYQILSDWKEDTPKTRWKKSDYRSILRWVINVYEEKNKKNKKEELEINSKELNIRWLNDKIKALTRSGARGNLCYYQDSDLVVDSVLGKKTALSSVKMIDIVKSWDQYRRF
jgi:hypothetical protein